MRKLRVRFWFEAAIALCTCCLALLTILWPDWIELVFGVDPDHGSGRLEWAAVAALAVAGVAASIATRVEWRHSAGPMRSATATAPPGP
ncbi:MAG TPA: hypothetical protein VGF23_04190 [Gaiellaceae bacterium]|jgi:hypothetical protein